MVYKYQMANFLASKKVAQISKMEEGFKPEHYKSMTYEDWCKYYFSLPKKLLKEWYND